MRNKEEEKAKKQGGFGVVHYPDGWAVIDHAAHPMANIVAVRSTPELAREEAARLNKMMHAGTLPLLQHFSKGGNDRPPSRPSRGGTK